MAESRIMQELGLLGSRMDVMTETVRNHMETANDTRRDLEYRVRRLEKRLYQLPGMWVFSGIAALIAVLEFVHGH